MKITSDICKQEIVKSAIKNKETIRLMFFPPLVNAALDESKNIKNWKRIYKVKESNNTTLRIFNCVPFEDQLRAYVSTANDDNVIISVEITAE